jgi:ABC-type phosphate/phosphonate transport system substrate-binding protein
VIASLGMYDFGQASAANDRLWAHVRDSLRASGIAAPDALTRGEGAYWAAWTAPDLVLSQTCGYPFRARLYPKVQLVGTPDYGLPGCAPGHYNSVLVVRHGDPRAGLAEFAEARFAFNEDLSQSGWAAPQNHAAALGFYLRPALATGGHRFSVRAVADGKADIAAIDAQTWELLSREAGATDGLRILGRTSPATPALPFITGPGQEPKVIAEALETAIAALTPKDRAATGLKGLIALPAEAYLAVPSPPSPRDLGFVAG